MSVQVAAPTAQIATVQSRLAECEAEADRLLQELGPLALDGDEERIQALEARLDLIVANRAGLQAELAALREAGEQEREQRRREAAERERERRALRAARREWYAGWAASLEHQAQVLDLARELSAFAAAIPVEPTRLEELEARLIEAGLSVDWSAKTLTTCDNPDQLRAAAALYRGLVESPDGSGLGTPSAAGEARVSQLNANGWSDYQPFRRETPPALLAPVSSPVESTTNGDLIDAAAGEPVAVESQTATESQELGESAESRPDASIAESAASGGAERRRRWLALGKRVAGVVVGCATLFLLGSFVRQAQNGPSEPPARPTLEAEVTPMVQLEERGRAEPLVAEAPIQAPQLLEPILQAVRPPWPEKGRDANRLEFPAFVAPEAASASTVENRPGPKLVSSSGLGARLRAEPRLEGTIVEILPEGAEVQELGEERVTDGRAWQKVTSPSGKQGWLDGTLLRDAGSEPRSASGAAGPVLQSLVQRTATPQPAESVVVESSAVSGSAAPRQVAATAVQFLGHPYRWGGASPAGFDCAGFVAYVYGSEGQRLPSSLGGQLASGRRVGVDELRAGDLVFFANTYMPGLSHVGIYVGGGRFVHAADERNGVVTSSMWDHYWGPRYYGASRPGRA